MLACHLSTTNLWNNNKNLFLPKIYHFLIACNLWCSVSLDTIYRFSLTKYRTDVGWSSGGRRGNLILQVFWRWLCAEFAEKGTSIDIFTNRVSSWRSIWIFAFFRTTVVDLPDTKSVISFQNLYGTISYLPLCCSHVQLFLWGNWWTYDFDDTAKKVCEVFLPVCWREAILFPIWNSCWLQQWSGKDKKLLSDIYQCRAPHTKW